MKLFEEVDVVKHEEPVRQVSDSSEFIKRNLMKSVTRSDKVRDAVEKWLFSWEGAISKDVFSHQMKRLDWDDDKAIQQLLDGMGRRIIPLPKPEKHEPLNCSLVEKMLSDTYVAVHGRGFKKAIKQAVSELKTCGQVYVLQVEEFILQFKGFEDKGRAPEMIDKAIEADFLVIVDLEMPIHLEWHISEAISRIGRRREAHKKPIISTWCRFNDCNEFFKRFKIYEAK